MFRNIWCKGSRCLKQDAWTDGLRNKRKNLVKISPLEPIWMLNTKTNQLKQKQKQMSYEPYVLKQLVEIVKHDNRYKWLPFGTVKQVLKLKLNNKNRSRKTQAMQCFKQTGVRRSNLTTIKKTRHKTDSNIIFSTCNMRTLNHFLAYK